MSSHFQWGCQLKNYYAPGLIPMWLETDESIEVIKTFKYTPVGLWHHLFLLSTSSGNLLDQNAKPKFCGSQCTTEAIALVVGEVVHVMMMARTILDQTMEMIHWTTDNWSLSFKEIYTFFLKVPTNTILSFELQGQATGKRFKMESSDVGKDRHPWFMMDQILATKVMFWCGLAP